MLCGPASPTAAARGGAAEEWRAMPSVVSAAAAAAPRLIFLGLSLLVCSPAAVTADLIADPVIHATWEDAVENEYFEDAAAIIWAAMAATLVKIVAGCKSSGGAQAVDEEDTAALEASVAALQQVLLKSEDKLCFYDLKGCDGDANGGKLLGEPSRPTGLTQLLMLVEALKSTDVLRTKFQLAVERLARQRGLTMDELQVFKDAATPAELDLLQSDLRVCVADLKKEDAAAQEPLPKIEGIFGRMTLGEEPKWISDYTVGYEYDGMLAVAQHEEESARIARIYRSNIEPFRGREWIAATPRPLLLQYEWDHQVTVRRLCESLEKRGYRVTIDIKHQNRDYMDWIREAIAEAEIMLFDVSAVAKTKLGCKMEALMGHYHHRDGSLDMIPILYEEDYVPTGWLALLVGNRSAIHPFFGDLDEPQLEERVDALAKELGDRCNQKREQEKREREKKEEEARVMIEGAWDAAEQREQTLGQLAQVGAVAVVDGKLGEIIAMDKDVWVRLCWSDGTRALDWTHVDRLSMVVAPVAAAAVNTGDFAETQEDGRLGQVIAKENEWVRLRFVDDGTETLDWIREDKLSGHLVASRGAAGWPGALDWNGTLATMGGRLGQVIAQDNVWVRLRWMDDRTETADWVNFDHLSPLVKSLCATGTVKVLCTSKDVRLLAPWLAQSKVTDVIVIRPNPQSFPLTVLDMKTLVSPGSLLALSSYRGPRLLAYQQAAKAAGREEAEAPVQAASEGVPPGR